MTAPHSLEAEASVLGAAILSVKAREIALDLLKPTDFYRNSHGLLFDTIDGLHREGVTVDTTTLTERLATWGRLDEVGGALALSELATATPTPSAAEHYAKIVVRKAAERRAIDAAGKFIARVRDGADLDSETDGLVESLANRPGLSSTVDHEDVATAFIERLSGGELVPAYRTGWASVDKRFRFGEGLLTTITGLPGSGKSTWLDVALYNVLRANPDVKVAYFSPEQGPADKHLINLVHTSLGTDPFRATGLGEKIEEHRRWWQDRVEWINDDRDNTPSAVLAVARAKVRDGVRILVVDPYNNLAPDGGARGDRQDLEIQDLLRRLKRFGKSTGCHVVVVAHPKTQVPVMGTDAVYRIPTAGQISGGNEWWNHSDAVVTVWRNQSNERPDEFGQPEDVKIVVSKVRDAGHWGQQGTETLRFDADARRYEETRA